MIYNSGTFPILITRSYVITRGESSLTSPNTQEGCDCWIPTASGVSTYAVCAATWLRRYRQAVSFAGLLMVATPRRPGIAGSCRPRVPC
ncbi:MAG: hypothetical protein MUE60_11635, partial [Candidatus Eisenbacteria bacterium]|nr:hypothetical protein [Candidatus Eisenbacteria bacterium]